MNSSNSMQNQNRKPILRDGVLPDNPTPLETHAQFALEMADFFKDCGAKTTYCIVAIHTDFDQQGKAIGSYHRGVFTIRASSRTLAEHTAHTMYVHCRNVAVKAFTAGEIHEQNRDYLLMESMRGKVFDADRMFEIVKERYVFDGVEMGPIPGTPDTFLEAVGRVFYPAEQKASLNNGNEPNGDGGTKMPLRTVPKPRRPPK